MMPIKILFWILWRIWFYILIAIPIIILFPFLLISISKEKWYPYFFAMAKIWAKFIIYGMGFRYRIEWIEKTEKEKSYILVANHTSMIDIMLMLALAKNPFVFVGKKELSKIPLFGFFYKRTCILVNRNDSESKKAVFENARKRIDKGISICIFPEGGVPDDESIILDDFKLGAFRLAISYQIPIVPVVFYNNKKFFSYTFFSGRMGLLNVKVLPFIKTKGKTLAHKKELREKTRQVIYKELKKHLSI